MKPDEWKTFGVFAAVMLGISFLDERIATTVVIITGLVIVLNHYRDAAPAAPGSLQEGAH